MSTLCLIYVVAKPIVNLIEEMLIAHVLVFDLIGGINILLNTLITIYERTRTWALATNLH
jgi:hypothetical protein